MLYCQFPISEVIVRVFSWLTLIHDSELKQLIGEFSSAFDH